MKKLVKRSSALLFVIVMVMSMMVVPASAFVREYGHPNITFSAHVQNYGWMNEVGNGGVVGTTGQSLRMESLKVRVKSGYANLSGWVCLQSHVQNIGWTGVSRNSVGICGADGKDVTTGTEGQSLRMEAVRIWLEGDIRNAFSVRYRAHVQNYGWMGWVSDGATAGTTGQSLRIEAIEIQLVEKGISSRG